MLVREEIRLSMSSYDYHMLHPEYNIPDTPDHICRERGLHDYEVKIHDNDEVIVSACTYCAHRITFRKIDDRIDNNRYVKTHLRWFLQPGDPLFHRFYGSTERFDEIKKSRKRKLGRDEKRYVIREEMNQAMKEARREWWVPRPTTNKITP